MIKSAGKESLKFMNISDLLKDERVCARLDEIAEAYQDSINVYKKYKPDSLIPLDDGQGEQRRYLIISGGEKYLLVEASMDLYYRKDLQFFYLRDIAGVDIIMPKILHKNCQKNLDGEEKFFHVFSYVDGQPLGEYLKTADSASAYGMGVQAGESLKKLHSAKMDRHAMPWWHLGRWHYERYLREYQPSPEFDKAFESYKSYYPLLDGRQSSFVHGSVKIDSFLVCDGGKVGFGTFDEIGTGDPWFDFCFCSVMAMENADFVNGLIDGYFENNVPELFFKLLKFYTAELVFTDLRTKGEAELIGRIRDFYDDFELDVPKWYGKVN